ncbi:MAG: hypothetical protein N3F05_02275 [Candidatus Diapherotrites archaeon]|nr:hypothetical protein [Candidatus Diapherotrites archaeon]
MILLHAFVALLYVLAFVIALAICRKLYGGGFSMALPYLISTVGLFTVLNIIKLFLSIYGISYTIIGAPELWVSIEILYILAGMMFVATLYQFYHTSYVTRGWEECK